MGMQSAMAVVTPAMDLEVLQTKMEKFANLKLQLEQETMALLIEEQQRMQKVTLLKSQIEEIGQELLTRDLPCKTCQTGDLTQLLRGRSIDDLLFAIKQVARERPEIKQALKLICLEKPAATICLESAIPGPGGLSTGKEEQQAGDDSEKSHFRPPPGLLAAGSDSSPKEEEPDSEDFQMDADAEHGESIESPAAASCEHASGGIPSKTLLDSIRKRTLVLAYFPRDSKEADLLKALRLHGTPRKIQIVRDEKTGNSRCFAFAEFVDKEDAEVALHACEEGTLIIKDLKGHAWHLKASWAKRTGAVAATLVERGKGLRVKCALPVSKMQ